MNSGSDSDCLNCTFVYLMMCRDSIELDNNEDMLLVINALHLSLASPSFRCLFAVFDEKKRETAKDVPPGRKHFKTKV